MSFKEQAGEIRKGFKKEFMNFLRSERYRSWLGHWESKLVAVPVTLGIEIPPVCLHAKERSTSYRDANTQAWRDETAENFQEKRGNVLVEQSIMTW